MDWDIDLIEQGESGASVRAKLNLIIEGINERTIGGVTPGDLEDLIDTEAPAVPTGLLLSSSLTPTPRLFATWFANTELDFSQYDVQIKEGAGNWVSTPTNTNSYAWPARAGITYQVRLRAIDRAGNRSNYTDAEAPNATHTVAPDNIPPAMPVDLNVDTGFGVIWLKWTPNTEDDLKNYEIYESDSITAPDLSTPATYTSDAASWARTGLGKGITRHYWVRAVDFSGNRSVWTPRKSGTTTTITLPDVNPIIELTDYALGIQPPKNVTVLPALPYPSRKVFRTTDNTFWIQNAAGTSWVRETDASQLVGQIVTSQLIDEVITNAKLASNSVGPNQVQADAIRVEHLLVTGQGNAINPDPFFEDASRWAASGVAVKNIGDGPVGSRTLYASTPVSYLPDSTRFPIDPSKTYLLETRFRRIAGDRAVYGIWHFFDASGNLIYDAAAATGWPAVNGAESNYYMPANASPANGTWQRYTLSVGPSGTAGIPAAARFMSYGFLFNYSLSGTTNGEQQANLVRVTEMGRGELIVDGSITATKIAAGQVQTPHLAAGSVTAVAIAALSVDSMHIKAAAITAGKIAVSAVGAEQIASKAITVEKLAVTGQGNAINPDPFFEDQARWTASGATTKAIADGARGSNVLFHNGISTAIYFNNNRFPIEPSKTYHLEVAYRRVSGDRAVYGIWHFFDGSGNLIYDAAAETGWPATNSTESNYYMPAGATNTAWQVHKLTIGPGGTAAIPAAARYIAYGFLFNYSGSGTTNGEQQINAVRVTEMARGELIVDGSIVATKLAASNVITLTAQIQDAIITSAKIVSLDAGKIQAGTVLSNSITVNGTALGTVESRAADPAARINAHTTKILPGQITISGGTTLSDWRQGGDTTKIAGGAISANTVEANKLSIGLRNIAVEGVEIEHNKPAANQVSWSAGTIKYANDSGVISTVTIAAGNSITYTGSPLYIYWTKDTTAVASTTFDLVTSSPTHVCLAVYRGGTDLVVNVGRTIVDGSHIKTETIDAQQIKSSAVITRHLSAGSVTAEKIAIGFGGNEIGNADFSADLTDWGSGSNNPAKATLGNWAPDSFAPPGNMYTYLHTSPAGVYVYAYTKDTRSGAQKAYNVIPGKRYELSVYTYGHRSIRYCSIMWYNAAGSLISQSDSSAASAEDGSPGGSIAAYNRIGLIATAPAGAVKAMLFFWHSHATGVDSLVWWVMPQFCEALASQTQFSPWSNGGGTLISGGHIKTNSVTADKINVTDLSAITANVGTLTAGVLRSPDNKFIINLTNGSIEWFD